MRSRLQLPLFLLAVAMAVLIKIAVNEALQLAETTINAQVQYNLPQRAMILEPIQHLEVRLRGERSDIAGLNPFNVQVEVSLADLAAKDYGAVDVTEDRFTVRAPGDFEVISITPNQMTLTIERVESRSLPVRAGLTGEPAAGAVLQGEPEVRPATAQVDGPRSRLRDVTELTAPVSLNGHALTFEEKVTIVSPDPLVRIVEPRQVVVFIPLKVPGSDTPLDEEPDEP